ncbi:MAG TPA: bifunctional precorrin-2 dehydrogenase/sirohydrochlorin ferrochelatase [Actinomycetota bacterium]|nr:bifunctional precorrin-2 dehydrogenase/sirohydrochlorin ferrochelatase [Actinomycetota bacterium]
MTTPLYMACLSLAGERVVVVGGDAMAQEKVAALIECGATVVVFTEEVTEAAASFFEDHGVELHRRAFDPTDLDGSLLAVVTSRDPDLQRRVHEAARDRSMLVNVADVPELCNFILPAVHRAGPVVVAVSTSGASPALAQRIRGGISREIDGAYAELASILEDLRPWAKENLPSYEERRDFFRAVVDATPDPVELLRSGRRSELHDMIERTKAAASSRLAR